MKEVEECHPTIEEVLHAETEEILVYNQSNGDKETRLYKIYFLRPREGLKSSYVVTGPLESKLLIARSKLYAVSRWFENARYIEKLEQEEN